MAPLHPRTSLLQNWKAMAACTLIGLAPFQYGVDLGMIGGLQAMTGFLKVFGYQDTNAVVGWNISPVVQQLITSLMTLGACIGAITAGPMGKYLGRRHSLWIACLFCGIADAIMLGTTNIGGLYAGRLLIGIANGWFMTLAQLYINECAPAQFRGLAMGIFEFWRTFGSLVGTIVDNFTATIDGRSSYMIPLAVLYVVPLILSVGMLFVPESPRWLMEQGKIEQAKEALTWLRPDKEVIEVEMEELKMAQAAHLANINGVGFLDLFRDPVDRRRTLLSVVAISLLGGSGGLYVLSYGTYFFEMAGVGQPFQNTCILLGLAVAATVVSFFIVVRVGRRPLVLTGIFMCGILQLINAAVYQAAPKASTTGNIVVALTVVFLIFYNGSIAGYAWLLAAEMPSQRLRSMTVGLTASIGFLEGWLATFTAPYFINPDALNWGPKYGYIWFPSCTITGIAVYLVIPETKDRTLEELDEMFALRLPARKFKKHVCVGQIPGHPHTDGLDNSSSNAPLDEKTEVTA